MFSVVSMSMHKSSAEVLHCHSLKMNNFIQCYSGVCPWGGFFHILLVPLSRDRPWLLKSYEMCLSLSEGETARPVLSQFELYSSCEGKWVSGKCLNPTLQCTAFFFSCSSVVFDLPLWRSSLSCGDRAALFACWIFFCCFTSVECAADVHIIPDNTLVINHPSLLHHPRYRLRIWPNKGAYLGFLD